FRDALPAPRLRLGLEAAEQDLPGVLLVVGALVRHAENRKITGQVFDRLGHDVEVLAGVQGHVDPGHAADLPPPHAAAVHHHLRRDLAPPGNDARDPAILRANARHLRVLEDLDAL